MPLPSLLAPRSSLLLLLATLASAQEFIAKPYLQPGPAGAVGPTDTLFVRWITDSTPGDFTLSVHPAGGQSRAVAVTREPLEFSQPRQSLLRYTARIDGLPTDSSFRYSVQLNGTPVREAAARTRATPGHPVRLALLGDMASGKPGQQKIAHQIALADPRAVITLGDIVYKYGRMSEYTQHFWHTYANAANASPTAGAPLMGTVVFHATLGNHDAFAGRLASYDDALAAFLVFTAPLTGPSTPGPWATQLPKGQLADRFRQQAGPAYPALSMHSYDHGDIHFAVVDNSGGGKSDDPAVARWLEQDLRASKARWKAVLMHCPPFQASVAHYTEQRQRRLAPLLEACKVDLVFSGHVHNYQRSRPLRFQPFPGTPKGAPSSAYVNGRFTLDTTFDGAGDTTPDGVIYIVAGGGGTSLNKTPIKDNLEDLPGEGRDNFAPYNAATFATDNSFVLLETSGPRLTLRALDASGREVDRIAIDKR
ncbi:MAG: metallophosphoesterase family protein [Opitutia bacterium]|jgi:3',5'-cyclic AMP phosphodiesterase CpdA